MRWIKSGTTHTPIFARNEHEDLRIWWALELINNPALGQVPANPKAGDKGWHYYMVTQTVFHRAKQALHFLTMGLAPGIGSANLYDGKLVEDKNGVHLEYSMEDPSPEHNREHLNEALLRIWSHPKLRERLRRCTNCGDFYFQKTKKRNKLSRYFCSSVRRDRTCASDWHDAQKSPNRTHRKPKQSTRF